MGFIKKIIQSLTQKSEKTVTIIIVLAIFITVNFLSYQAFIRTDLTQGKIYSISNVSKKTVEELDDIVKIKLYFSKNLPNQYIITKQRVNDILSEYVTYSNGNIQIEHIDPKEMSEDSRRSLAIMGIPTLQFNVMKNDTYQVMQGYMGVVVQYGDKYETIPVVDQINDFEYKITMDIKKVVNSSLPSVGLITNHDVLIKDNGLESAYKKLSEVYKVKEIDLASDDIPTDIKTLILPGPKEEISEEEFKKLDSFLVAGNSLMILVDGVNIEEGLVATKNETKVKEFLKKYGVILNNDIVMDESSGRVSFTSGFMQFFTNYPAWVKVIKDDFNQNNSAVSELESATFPWVSSLEIADNINEEEKVTYLAKTTKKAWRQTENFKLDPNKQKKSGSDQYTLAFLVTGKFKSAYGEETGNGKLLVVGDSDFINDKFIKRNNSNLVFFQNLVDYITLGDDLIKIRSKGVTDRSIKEIDASTKQKLKYGNIFGLTIIVILIGVTRYYLRRRKKIEI